METDVTSLICSLGRVNVKKNKHLQVKDKEETLLDSHVYHEYRY